MDSDNQEFVYFIQEEKSDCFKVGATRASIEGRLSSLQQATYHRLTVRYVVGPLCRGDAWILEGLLHSMLASKRVRGEWFRLPEIVSITGDSHVKKLIASVGFIPGTYAYAEINVPGLRIPVKMPSFVSGNKAPGPRNERVMIPLTHKEKDSLRAMAHKDQRSMTNFTRKLVWDAIAEWEQRLAQGGRG